MDGAAVTYSPPANVDAEEMIVCGLLQKNRVYDHISDYLLPGHFYDGFLASVYEAIGKLIDGGQEANMISVSSYLNLEYDGRAYLGELQGAVVVVANPRQYADLIIDAWRRRQLCERAQEYMTRAQGEEAGGTLTESLTQELLELSDGKDTNKGLHTYVNSINTALENIEAAYHADGALTGHTSGLTDVDARLGGLHRGDLIVVAGRPGMGKTALAWGWAVAVAHTGHPVLYFSREMPSEQLAMRHIASEAGVSVERIRQGRVSEDEYRTCCEVGQRLKNLPLYIDDRTSTPQGMMMRARRAKRKLGLGLVVVDYLQRMSDKAENRTREVGQISSATKSMAIDLDVPVVLLSQLNRAVEQREDKRPNMADLRESGDIEQDADVVALLYREQYYLENYPPKQGENESDEKFQQRESNHNWRLMKVRNTAEIIVNKNRHGSASVIHCGFQPERTRFYDLATGYEE